MQQRVAVNELGYRIGEGHHNATISDATVKLVRDLRELHHLTLPEIARKTGVAEGTVKLLVYYRRRAQLPASYRTRDDGAAEG